jgi:hypothetical protein
VLTDALELGNGVTLELYGIYAGKTLYDYAVRYRGADSTGQPLLDRMLERRVEIPA